MSEYSTFIGYSWTIEDNDELVRLGSNRHDWRAKDYCENKLKEKRDQYGKLINKDKMFVWKGRGADPHYAASGIVFIGCGRVSCCQKKLREFYLYSFVYC